MKPIDFPERNILIAEHQEEFITLPALQNIEDGSATFCVELNDDEIEEIKSTGKVWFKQYIGDKDFQPIQLSTMKEELIPAHMLKERVADQEQRVDWIAKAIQYDMGRCRFNHKKVRLESRKQNDGTFKWIVVMQGAILGKDGEFYFGPNRKNEFIKFTRFNSRDECHKFWIDNVKGKKEFLIWK